MDKKLQLENFLEMVFETFSAIAGSMESRDRDDCDSEIPLEVCSFENFKCIWKEKNVSEIVHNIDYSPAHTIHFNSVTDTWREEYKKSIKEIFEWLILKLFQFPKSRLLKGNFNSLNSNNLLPDNTNISNGNSNSNSSGKSSQSLSCTVCSPNSSLHIRCNSDDLGKDCSKAFTDAFIWNICILFMLYCVHQTQLFRSIHKPDQDVFIRVSLESFQLLCMSVEGYINTFYYSPAMRENNAVKKIFDKLLSISAFQLVHLPICLSSGDIKAKVLRSQVERAQNLKSHQQRLVVRVHGVCEALRSLHDHKLQFRNILCLVPSIVASYSELVSRDSDNLAAQIDDSKGVENDSSGLPDSNAVEENPIQDDTTLIKNSNSDSGVIINVLESLPEDISNFDEFFFGTAMVQETKSSSMTSQNRLVTTSLPSLSADNKPSYPVDIGGSAEVDRILAELEEQSREVLGIKSPSRSDNSVHYIGTHNLTNGINDSGSDGGGDDVEADDDAWMNDIEPDSTDKDTELAGVSHSEESADQSAQEDLARLLLAIEEQSNSIIQSNNSAATTTSPPYSHSVGNKRKVDSPIGTHALAESYISESMMIPKKVKEVHSERVVHNSVVDSVRSKEPFVSEGEEDMEHLLGLLEQQSAAVFEAVGNHPPDSLPANEGDSGSCLSNGSPTKKRKTVAKAIKRSPISANTKSTARRRKKTVNERVTSDIAVPHPASNSSNLLVDEISGEMDIAALLSSLEQQTATVLVATSSHPTVDDTEEVHKAPPSSEASDEAKMLALLQQLEQLSDDTLRREVM
eukprot:gene28959-37995_t